MTPRCPSLAARNLTALLPDDATSYNGVPIADQPLDACYIILCDTAEEAYDYLDDGA